MKQELSSLSPTFWPFDLDWLPPDAYLVGGSVRDALLNRQAEHFDLDFVLPQNAVETARKIAHHYQAGFVILDEQRQIARVVFEQGTVDFAQQDGKTVKADLQRRDFTVNAIAYHPYTQSIQDPFGGLKDLEQKKIRMIARKNLKDDPLRILRAYRQATQLEFTIDSSTRSALQQLAPQLSTVAAERVQTELNYILSQEEGNPWLTKAWEDGVLGRWLENIEESNLQQVAQVNQCSWLLGKIWHELEDTLTTQVGNQSLSLLGLAKLASLLSPNPSQAESQLVQLKYSRAEIVTVTKALKYLPRLCSLQTSPLSLREQYFFFLDVKEGFPTTVVLTVAKISAQEKLREARAVGLVAPLINSYLDPQDQVAHPTPLVTGEDLMRSLSLPPGPKIGQLLTELQIARAETRITTVEEALEFATAWLKD